VAIGAAMQTKEPLGSLLLRNKGWLMAGAHLPDVYYAAEAQGRSYRQLLESNAPKSWEQIRPAIEDSLKACGWDKRYGISNEEILSWQLPWYWYGHRYMAAHQFVDELARFIREGNEHKIAFLCGVWTHYEEEMTWVGKTYANLIWSKSDLKQLYGKTVGTANIWSPITGMVQDYIANNIALTDEKMAKLMKERAYQPKGKTPDDVLHEFRARSEEQGFRIVKAYFDLMYADKPDPKVLQDLVATVEQSYVDSALCAACLFNFAQEKATSAEQIRVYDGLETAPTTVLSLTKEQEEMAKRWFSQWGDFIATKAGKRVEVSEDALKGGEGVFEFASKLGECEKGTLYLDGTKKIGFDSGGGVSVDNAGLVHISVPSGRNWSLGAYMAKRIALPKREGKAAVLSFSRAGLNLGYWGKVVEFRCSVSDVKGGVTETLLREFIQGKEKIGEWERYCFDLSQWAGKEVEVEFAATVLPNFRGGKEVGLRDVRIVLVDESQLKGLQAKQKSNAAEVLFSFDKNFDMSRVEARKAKATVCETEGGWCLRIATEPGWPEVVLKAPQGHPWDLSPYEYLELSVRDIGKAGEENLRVWYFVGNQEVPEGSKGGFELTPGESTVIKVPLIRYPKGVKPVKLIGMQGYPEFAEHKGFRIDPTNVTQIRLVLPGAKQAHLFEIEKITAAGRYKPSPLENSSKPLLPFIDAFGQYMHQEWSGKIHSVDDFARRREEENLDLDKHPGPSKWDKYGGWEAGPQLEATGYFRVQKYEGKWWLVDPEGRLFWSHGIDVVQDRCCPTPITDRKEYFADLPEPGSELSQFYFKSSWASFGYYAGKTFECFNFHAANLFRKYGRDWKRQFAEVSHRRLRSWGMNTIGAWASDWIYLMRKTPYVVIVHTAWGNVFIQGSKGFWGKFPDPFDPRYKEQVRNLLGKEKGKSAGDPWCVGFFVDNELSWGDELSLAIATLASPAEQPAKRVFIEDLKAKYATIEKLNETWGTQHASWEALLQSTTPPDPKKAHDDLAAFYTKIAEEYFRICRDAVKEVAPNQLYLGCRFAWADWGVNDRAAQIAAKYCDVVSYNLYWADVKNFRLPGGVDKPVLIGEFNFSTTERGLFGAAIAGVRWTIDEAERAKAYTNYVLGALQNPLIIGAHFFEYMDEMAAGRGDGENSYAGFLDVTDTPYPEIIEASRAIAARMYEYRRGGKLSP